MSSTLTVRSDNAAELGTQTLCSAPVKRSVGLTPHAQSGPGDVQEAIRYCHQAAALGHPRATYNMGAFYASGQYMDQNMAEAAKWYARSSGLGNPRATATLALMYAQGSGVEQDLEYAEELFDMADYMGFDVSHLRERSGLPPL